MNTMLEKKEIKSGIELDEKLGSVCNLATFNHEITFTTEEIFNFLIKNGYKIYVVDIYAQIYTKICEYNEVRYENPKQGVAQAIVGLSWNDEIPTTENEVGKYNVYSIFDRIMKEKLLNI